MEKTKGDTLTGYSTFQELIEMKSKRDLMNFTAYHLAMALDIPKSMVSGLTEHDSESHITNPKMGILNKVIKFFVSENAEETLEQLLKKTDNAAIDVENQESPFIASQKQIVVPLYFMDPNIEKPSTVKVLSNSKSKNIFGIHSNRDIKPVFKKGSIFIIDPDEKIEDGTLIAARIENNLHIKKYIREKNKYILKSYDPDEKPIVLMPTINYLLLGVVVQIIANT